MTSSSSSLINSFLTLFSFLIFYVLRIRFSWVCQETQQFMISYASSIFSLSWIFFLWTSTDFDSDTSWRNSCLYWKEQSGSGSHDAKKFDRPAYGSVFPLWITYSMYNIATGPWDNTYGRTDGDTEELGRWMAVKLRIASVRTVGRTDGRTDKRWDERTGKVDCSGIANRQSAAETNLLFCARIKLETQAAPELKKRKEKEKKRKEGSE